MSKRHEPENRRDFAGRGPLINLLRALHLVGVVGTGAAVLGALAGTATMWYVGLLIFSGIGIATLDRWADPAYFRQLNGQLVLLKLLSLGVVGWLAGFGSTFAVWFWLVLVASALMTHAPGWLRHRKLW